LLWNTIGPDFALGHADQQRIAGSHGEDGPLKAYLSDFELASPQTNNFDLNFEAIGGDWGWTVCVGGAGEYDVIKAKTNA
jgi:hypothetical protein